MRLAAALLVLALAAAPAWGRTLRLALPSTLEQSGLPKQLVARFLLATGIEVAITAGPTARLVELARGDGADVVLLDDKAEGDKLAAQRRTGKPVPVMTTEFLLVGPKNDPAKAAGKDIAEALKKVDATRSLFISRGDQSLSYAAELRFWALAGIQGPRRGSLRECKCGMGGVLDIAGTAFGYAIPDKGTWAAFRNRGDLVPLVEADPRLVLTHSALVVHDTHKPKTDAEKAEHAQRARDAQKFVQWLTGPEAQAAITAYRVGGQPYFQPVAAPAASAPAPARK